MINNNNTVDFKQLEVVRMARAIECTVRSFNNTIFLGYSNRTVSVKEKKIARELIQLNEYRKMLHGFFSRRKATWRKKKNREKKVE